jgi:hypothetical protein
MAGQYVQHAFAAALVDPAAPVPAGLTTARGAPDPQRFAVYRNNVVAGLGKALESRFPVTLSLVGEEFFRGMARAFIAVNRPRSPLIAEYGDELPAFIEAFPAAASVPYLADVARLEALWSRAYHAADGTALSVDTLAAVPAEKLAEARLEPHPSAALIRSMWPIGSIWAAHQEAEVRPVGHARAETVLILRPDTDVTVHILPAKDTAFAQALFADAALGDAAEAALAADGSFDFGSALVGLVGLGAFAAIVFSEKGAAA